MTEDINVAMQDIFDGKNKDSLLMVTAFNPFHVLVALADVGK